MGSALGRWVTLTGGAGLIGSAGGIGWLIGGCGADGAGSAGSSTDGNGNSLTMKGVPSRTKRLTGGAMVSNSSNAM